MKVKVYEGDLLVFRLEQSRASGHRVKRSFNLQQQSVASSEALLERSDPKALSIIYVY
jgi:hypothetical protein